MTLLMMYMYVRTRIRLSLGQTPCYCDGGGICIINNSEKITIYMYYVLFLIK